MGAFDDIMKDVPGAAVAAGGTFNDVTGDLQPGVPPPGPNTFRVNWGPFGYNEFDVEPNSAEASFLGLVSDANYYTNAALRGGVNGLSQIPEAIYASFWGPNAGKLGIKPEDAYQPQWGTAVNDAIGVPARDPNAGFGTDVAEAFGGSIMTPGAGSGGFFRSLGSEAISAVTSVLGADAGSWIGEQIGGEQGARVGEFTGSFGGGAAPSVGKAGGNAVLRNTFAKPGDGSGVAFDALERAGIRPTPALVGNKQAARTMNSAANFPLVGGTVQARQHASFEDFQSSLYNATDRIGPRVQPGVEAPRPPQMVGGRMRVAAGRGSDNLNDQFETGYTGVMNDVPPETLVVPDNLNAEVARQGNAFTGESRATQGAVQGFVQQEIDPALLARQGPTPPTVGPQFGGRPLPGGEPAPSGVPFQVARKARTEAFYDAQGGKMAGGAVDQVRSGFTEDMANSLMNDEAMIARYPDAADRAEIVQRLRVLDTEYALTNARDVSRAGAVPGAEGRLYVGGDNKALKNISEAPDDLSALNRGSEPGHMAVLQRTDPASYPSIAADVVRNEAQGKAPYGDINVSPQVFASWWNSLDENSKLIYTNERSFGTSRSLDPSSPWAQAIENQPTPTMNRLDNLGQAGELFRQAGAEANPSGTAPTLAMMGLMAGALTHPLSTLGGLVSGGAMARGMSGVDMARTIANRGQTTADIMLDAMRRTAGYQNAINARPNYGGPR